MKRYEGASGVPLTVELYACSVVTGSVQATLSEARWTNSPPMIPDTSDSFHEFDLDTYLADEHLDQIRVTALDKGAARTFWDSNPSHTTFLIDTPFDRVDGDSRATSDGRGQIKLTVPPIEEILGPGYSGGEYSFRYRKLLNDHTALGWKPNVFANPPPTTRECRHIHRHSRESGYPKATGSKCVFDSYRILDSRFRGNDGNRRLETDILILTTLPSDNPITGLDLEEIYAVQFIYEITEPGNSISVYAGRDSFAWPSTRAAGGGERVATFPLNSTVSNGEYSYRICDDTFPAADLADWKRVIRHALGQWQLATDGLVKMNYENGQACADYTGVVQQIADRFNAHIQINMPPMLVPITDNQKEMLRNYLKNLGTLTKLKAEGLQWNEVIMIDNSPMTNFENLRKIAVFPEFTTEIGLAGCAFNIRVAACAVTRYGDVTDILLRKTATTPLGPVPGGDDHVEKDDVHFNKCGFARRRAYENLIHEAGHALGILGGSRDPDWADSVGGHPTVPGSVMSYEGRNLRIAGLPYRLDDDPDCAPHPLDIMAIYALYQTMRNP